MYVSISSEIKELIKKDLYLEDQSTSTRENISFFI